MTIKKAGYIASIFIVMGAGFWLQYNALRDDAKLHSKTQSSSTMAYYLASKQAKVNQSNLQNKHSASDSNTPVTSTIAEPPRVDYEIELVGSIVTSPGKGSAFIKLNSGETYNYKVGEIITDDVVLKEVHRNKAIFQDNDSVFEIAISSPSTNDSDIHKEEFTGDQKPVEMIAERSFSSTPPPEENLEQDHDVNWEYVEVTELKEGQTRTFGPVVPPEPDYPMIENDTEDEVTLSLMEHNDPGMSRTFAKKPAPDVEPTADQDVVVDSDQSTNLALPSDNSY